MTRGTGLCFCFGLSAFMAVSARAETITWTGTTSTNWGYTNNWNLGRIPAPGDDVVIDGGVKQPTLGLAASPSIGSLVIGANNASTLTVENASLPTRQLVVSGNFTVGQTGVVTHPAPPNNTETEYHMVNIRVEGGLTIALGGRIDTDGRGYLANKGPGKAAVGNDGGSHGGLGYAYSGLVPGSKTYGNWLTPTNWGSGGSSGSGGGGIRLEVVGEAVVNGMITAKGGAGSAGGAGGSVWLTAATLSGSGLIRADGGDHNNTAGGGGGRVALYLTNATALGSVAVTAYGGCFTNVTVKSKAGAAGTIYIEGKDDLPGRGQLIIDNDNRNAGEPVTTRLPAGSWSVYNLALRNRGVLDVWTNASLAIYTNPVSTGGEVTNQGLRMAGGSLSIQGIDLMISNWSFIVDGPGTASLTGNVTVATNGSILHSMNGTGDAYRIDLAIDGNLTIQPGGRVDVDARGFKSGSFGPGKGTSNDGGGHGGFGGSYGSSLTSFTYGSILNPVRSGSSSSYGAGGGAIKLTVTGVTMVDGWITAKGGALVPASSGGAGGSIWLTSGSLAGSGFIRADGGDHMNTAGGGGGRISITLTNAVSFGAVTVTAAGGKRIPGSATLSAGAAGTIYRQGKGQALGEGSLTLDNLSATSAVRCTTLISSSTTDRVVGNVVWQNNARFELGTNQTLEVTGSWTNGSPHAFIANSGSTVIFSGTNKAAIYGSNAFFNLTCTNAGKDLLFEPDRTTVVKPGGTFIMRGGLGNWLGLHSLTPGSAWYLTLQSGSFQDVAYVSVRDSNANGGETVTAPTGFDEGGNVKWDFASGGLAVWTGAGDTNWGNTNNWSTFKVPTQADTVVIPDTSNDPALDAARELAGLTNQAGAVLRLNGNNLIVNGQMANAGSLIASGGETLTFRGDVDLTGGSVASADSTFRLEGAAPQTFTPAGNTLGDVVVVNPAVTFENGFTARDIAVGAVTNGLTFKGAVQARDITVASTGSVVAFRGVATARGLFCTAPAARLTFADGADYVFTNLQLRGASGSPIVISNAPGAAAWKLNAVQWHGVRHVSVKGSDAQTPGGPMIFAPDSLDAGGNQNWNFSTWHTWSGGVSSNFAVAANWTNGTVPAPNGQVLIDGDYATAPWIDAATNFARLSVGIGRPSVLTINAPLAVAGDCVVGPGGVLQHAANSGSETYRLTLSVGGDLTVATNGAIDVAGLGYGTSQGPGTSTDSNDGGGHGGLGGDWVGGPSSKTYGSIVTPTNAGSGALYNGSGGGIIRLDVTGRTRVDGRISAKGGYVMPSTAGGAGGSVWLTTGTLEGTGLIHADGGDHLNTAGGGGGRVAVYVTNSASLGSVDIRAQGGRHPVSFLYPGAAGTVYIHTTAQGDQPGTLIVDNRNQSTLASEVTLVSSQTLDRTVGTVLIRSGGRFALGTNQSLEVRGSWTNDGVFSAATGSTLVLSGPVVVTVTGTNVFGNLTIEGPGKTVRFSSSGTNRVNGYLLLNRVTLNSTSPGTRWFLSLAPGGSQQVSRVAVQDANAADGQTIIAQKSKDGGNNVNWLVRRSDGALILVR